AKIASVSTPVELTGLASTWRTETSTARAQAHTAQLNAQVSGFGGVSGLLKDAQQAVSIAQADNLDSGHVPALIASVQSQFQSGADAGPAIQQLVSALQGLKSVISLNDNVAQLVRPLLLTIDQAAAESTPNAGSFEGQYSNLQTSFRNATEAAQLTTVQQQMSALTASVNQEISSDQCGHSVGAGRVITLNL